VVIVLSRFALWISYVLNANTYAVASAAYILWRGGRLGVASFLIEALFLGVLPVAPILVDAWRGKVDVFVSERVDRPVYFTYALLVYLAASLYYRFIVFNGLMAYFVLTYVVVTLAMTATTFKYKASVHACGIAGPTTFLVINYGISHAVLYLLLIPVYYARSRLGAHTLEELLLGSVIGICFTILTAVIVAQYPVIAFP
jgi:hypothetical protein